MRIHYISEQNSILNHFLAQIRDVNIQKDSLKNLIIGNVIKVKTVLQQNSSNKNPNQFDYGKCLADKQIYAQIYTNKTEIVINKNLKKIKK